MAKSTTESPSGRHRDLWRVEANRWVYSEYATPYERLLASKHQRGPGLEQGEELESADVPDRAAAIALAHQYLDRHAEEAVGRTSLEIHIRPPARELKDSSLYEVPPETVAQARRLGLKGDVAAQIKRMVVEADLTTDGRGNLKTHQYVLRIGAASSPGSARRTPSAGTAAASARPSPCGRRAYGFAGSSGCLVSNVYQADS